MKNNQSNQTADQNRVFAVVAVIETAGKTSSYSRHLELFAKVADDKVADMLSGKLRMITQADKVLRLSFQEIKAQTIKELLRV